MGLLNTYEVEVRLTLRVEAGSRHGAASRADDTLTDFATRNDASFTIVQARQKTDYR